MPAARRTDARFVARHRGRRRHGYPATRFRSRFRQRRGRRSRTYPIPNIPLHVRRPRNGNRCGRHRPVRRPAKNGHSVSERRPLDFRLGRSHREIRRRQRRRNPSRRSNRRLQGLSGQFEFPNQQLVHEYFRRVDRRLRRVQLYLFHQSRAHRQSRSDRSRSRAKRRIPERPLSRRKRLSSPMHTRVADALHARYPFRFRRQEQPGYGLYAADDRRTDPADRNHQFRQLRYGPATDANQTDQYAQSTGRVERIASSGIACRVGSDGLRRLSVSPDTDRISFHDRRRFFGQCADQSGRKCGRGAGHGARRDCPRNAGRLVSCRLQHFVPARDDSERLVRPFGPGAQAADDADLVPVRRLDRPDRSSLVGVETESFHAGLRYGGPPRKHTGRRTRPTGG